MSRQPRRAPGTELPVVSRRKFLAGGTVAMAAIASGVTGASPSFVERLLRKRYEMARQAPAAE